MKDLAIKIEDTCRACRAAYRCNGCVIGLRLDDGTQVRVNGQTKEITSVGGCTDGLQGGKCVQCSKHADDVADGVCCQECLEPFNGECGGQPKTCLVCQNTN